MIIYYYTWLFSPVHPPICHTQICPQFFWPRKSDKSEDALYFIFINFYIIWKPEPWVQNFLPRFLWQTIWWKAKNVKKIDRKFVSNKIQRKSHLYKIWRGKSGGKMAPGSSKTLWKSYFVAIRAVAKAKIKIGWNSYNLLIWALMCSLTVVIVIMHCDITLIRFYATNGLK